MRIYLLRCTLLVGFVFSLTTCSERAFKHVCGEYDFNGTQLLGILFTVSPSYGFSDILWDLQLAQCDCKKGKNTANCRLTQLAKNSGHMRQLNERVQNALTTIDWQSYATGTFTDEDGNTLLHKLALESEHLTDNDLYALIKTIDSVSGPNYTIPYSLQYALGKNTVFMYGTNYINGGMISSLVCNKQGKTAANIIEDKINGQSGWLKRTPSVWKELHKYLKDHEQREQSKKDVAEFIKTGKSS